MPQTKIRAHAEDKGELVIITTEHGQKAVIPKDKLCELTFRYNIQIENIKLNCQTTQKQPLEPE